MQTEAARARAPDAVPVPVLDRDADLVEHARLEVGVEGLPGHALDEQAQHVAVARVVEEVRARLIGHRQRKVQYLLP